MMQRRPTFLPKNAYQMCLVFDEGRPGSSPMNPLLLCVFLSLDVSSSSRFLCLVKTILFLDEGWVLSSALDDDDDDDDEDEDGPIRDSMTGNKISPL